MFAFAISEEVRVDWFRILIELGKEGYRLQAISHFTKIPRSTLIGYKQGAQPSYHNGATLLVFWSQATGKRQDWAPTISSYSYKA